MIDWIAYADRKPTKEDGNNSGRVLLTIDGSNPTARSFQDASGYLFWARINPPPKPQSEVEKCLTRFAETGFSAASAEPLIALIRAVVREEKP